MKIRPRMIYDKKSEFYNTPFLNLPKHAKSCI